MSTYPGRKVSVILKGQAKDEFEKLSETTKRQEKEGKETSDEMALLRSIRHKADALKLNPTYGEKIARKLIPDNIAVSNLFKVNLANYWRMLYTLQGNKSEVVVFVLWIVDHPTYDKMFGYAKR